MYRGVPIKKNNYKGVSYSKFLAILSVSNFLYYGFSFVFFTFFCPPPPPPFGTIVGIVQCAYISYDRYI